MKDIKEKYGVKSEEFIEGWIAALEHYFGGGAYTQITGGVVIQVPRRTIEKEKTDIILALSPKGFNP
jgi:hypothetical protein